MQSPELSSEILLLQQQLESVTKVFDAALKKDLQLSELKIIFHEMKLLRARLDELTGAKKNDSKNG